MRIHLMTDLEGVAGVVNHYDYCRPESRYYEQARALLTAEINAAVDGFFAGGATDVVVCDGHGPGAINCELLDERAKFSRGHYSPIFPFGLDEGFDAVAILGQHAKSGTPYSHLTHTGNFSVYDLSVNGLSIGEYGNMVLCAKELGIPAIFAAGEKAFAEEAEALTPGVVTVAVKRGLLPDDGHAYATPEEYSKPKLSAEHLTPAAARKKIRAGAKLAVERLKDNPKQFRHPDLKAPWHIIRRIRPLNIGRIQHAKDDKSFIAALNKLYGC